MSGSSCCVFSQPAVIFEVSDSFQDGDVELRFVATHRIHEGRELRIAVQPDNGPWDILDLNHPSYSPAWTRNVIREYSAATVSLKGAKQLRCAFLDPGLVLTQLQFRH